MSSRDAPSASAQPLSEIELDHGPRIDDDDDREIILSVSFEILTRCILSQRHVAATCSSNILRKLALIF